MNTEDKVADMAIDNILCAKRWRAFRLATVEMARGGKPELFEAMEKASITIDKSTLTEANFDALLDQAMAMAAQKACPKHKWTFVRNEQVSAPGFGPPELRVNARLRGVYECACGAKRNGAARAG